MATRILLPTEAALKSKTVWRSRFRGFCIRTFRDRLRAIFASRGQGAGCDRENFCAHASNSREQVKTLEFCAGLSPETSRINGPTLLLAVQNYQGFAFWQSTNAARSLVCSVGFELSKNKSVGE